MLSDEKEGSEFLVEEVRRRDRASRDETGPSVQVFYVYASAPVPIPNHDIRAWCGVENAINGGVHLGRQEANRLFVRRPSFTSLHPTLYASYSLQVGHDKDPHFSSSGNACPNVSVSSPSQREMSSPSALGWQRHCQLALNAPGVFMRASVPNLSRS
jgi:hypothetical protein